MAPPVIAVVPMHGLYVVQIWEVERRGRRSLQRMCDTCMVANDSNPMTTKNSPHADGVGGVRLSN